MPVLGGQEIGDECPACGWPIDPPERAQTATIVPGSATWSCEHCGWTMSASYHGVDDHSPRPGHP